MPEDAGPQWFRDNVSAPCESRFVTVEGCRIHYLAWRAARGDEATTTARRAGLVFLHGNAAHAHWWSFLAPFFAQEYDCIAVSWSGHGRSGWRDRYSYDLWAREVAAAAQDAELLGGGRPRPILVAHSMGAVVGAAVARQRGSALGGLLLLDELPRPPEQVEWMLKNSLTPLIKPRTAHKVMSGAVSPSSRFRLVPPQPRRNEYLLDFVAEHSVTRAQGSNGWQWAFDPQKMEKMPPEEMFPRVYEGLYTASALRALGTRVSCIVGDSSVVCSGDVVEWNRGVLGLGVPVVVAHDAGHHIMFDQPLALVAAIQATLAEWSRPAPAQDAADAPAASGTAPAGSPAGSKL